jgi:NDP-sugar pyrophosphorylase family protein
MLSHGIDCIPIVDKNRKVVSLVRWLDLFADEFKKLKEKVGLPVVIMAGGEGRRLTPFTHVLPKPLVPIGEKPILELIMEKFAEYGCRDFYLSLNYKSNIIRAYLEEFKHSYGINYIQEEKPLGTAGSLRMLQPKIKGTFFTTNCDTLIEADYSDILKFHRAKKNKITLVGSMKHYGIPYGVCDIENGGFLKNIREKPEYDFLVITGLYVLEPDILSNIPENRFYHMTDLINDCIKKEEKIGVYPVSEKSWIDLGQWEELQGLLKKFRIE